MKAKRQIKTRFFVCFMGIMMGLGTVMLDGGHPPSLPASEPIQLQIDFGRRIGPISPFIYGIAMPSTEHFRQLRVPLTRWGGNPSTRYNWVRGNCWNAARDWHFANVNYGNTDTPSKQPSGAADRAIATNSKNGSATLLTIPTLGWVARDDLPQHFSMGVPAEGGLPLTRGSEAIAGYDPTQNRRRVSISSKPRKGRPFRDPPDRNTDAVYQDEWVYHLMHKFGSSAAGGVKFYAMDNEPDLWDSTHTDMHPVQPDYDELLHTFLAYATAVKDVDPTAQITGPVSWGWSGYFFSPRDRGNDRYATHPDRRQHVNQAFIPWFLHKVAAHDVLTRRRTLDVLDVHFYPQGDGIYAGRTDADTNMRRLRSTRALWDAQYRDESWIDAPIDLIPRLRQWVRSAYPGTRIGLTEWNWGAEQTINGGLAVAEVLGILGREKVDLACYWTAPPVGSPAFLAYKLYRNADGQGNGFGDEAVPVESDAPHEVACFAANDTRRGVPTLILINQSTTSAHRVQWVIGGQRLPQYVSQYRLSANDPTAIAHLPDLVLPNHRLDITLPPTSITLYRGRYQR
jgi:hypothetical protein